MKKYLVLIVVILASILAACQSATPTTESVAVVGQKVTVDGGSYTNVTPEELHSMLKNKDFVLVNVHIPFEGNIAHTDLSIAYDQIEKFMVLLPTDKAARIVLYCRSGRMSDIAARTLVSNGYTNIWNLDGGMSAWEQAGYSIDR